MDIKIEIKEEPVCPNGTLTEVKSEYEQVPDFHSETVFVSSHFVKESANNKDICNKIEIKEEPHWSETISSEIKQEIELPSAAGVDWSEIKENASGKEEVSEDMVTDESSRLHTESTWRNSNCNKNSEENGWRNNSVSISRECHSRQQQMLEEPETNCTSDSDVKDRSLVQNHKTPYKYDVSERGFTLSPNVKQHNVIDDKKEYTCEICNKSFLRLSTLKRHKLIHEGKRLHTCEICMKSFLRSSTLNEHKLIHENKRPHKCEICNKCFTLASNLTRHKQIHDGKRLHVCEMCNKSFIRLQTLKRHKLIHEGKREHVCKTCEKSFIQPSELKKHELIHEGKRTHTCKICKKGFKLASQLKKHKLLYFVTKHEAV